MNKQSLAGGVAAAMMSLALVGCGSDSGDADTTSSATSSSAASSAETTTSETSSAAPTSTTAEAAGTNYTIAQYIVDEGIVDEPQSPNSPGAPFVNLPVPEGWQMLEQVPEGQYGAIVYPGTAVPDNPPRIAALLSKLTGPVDPAKILEYAPGDIMNFPGYTDLGPAEPATLGGFEAVEFGTVYDDEGLQTMIAQKTVVIPAPDGTLFALQLNAYASPDEADILGNALTAIDEQTTITFS